MPSVKYTIELSEGDRKTLEDIVRTYVEINNHCGGLLIINDEDDGRYDAYA